MTAASWPRPLAVPVEAWQHWRALREAVVEREPVCAADPDRWHSRVAADIAAASVACLTCHALQQCNSYAVAANEGVASTAIQAATDSSKGGAGSKLWRRDAPITLRIVAQVPAGYVRPFSTVRGLPHA